MSSNVLHAVIVVLGIVQYIENIMCLESVYFLEKFVSLESVESLWSLVYHHIADCLDFLMRFL